MVVEDLIKPEWVSKNSLFALPLGFALSIIGISIGAIVFYDQAALTGILFTIMAAIPFLRHVISERTVFKHKGLFGIFKRHSKLINVYLLFFVGVVIGYGLIFLIFPKALTGLLFDAQLATFTTGPSLVGYFSQTQIFFWGIVMNNLRILFIALLLSLIYGSGALLILTWNASVLGIFLVNLGRVSTAITYLPHATLEFIAFFLAAVAGGIIDIAIDQGGFGSETFNQRLMDAIALTVIAVCVIIAAAAVEVFIFPMFY